MIRKTLTILAVSCMMYSCGTKTESNPFFTEFQTEYGVPSFDKIKLEHYEPAFLKGIEEQNQNIQAIIASPEVPTFDNTIVALDSSAPILDRVSAIFFNMTDAETTDELTELSIKMAPVLSEHEDNISLNQELFKTCKRCISTERFHESDHGTETSAGQNLQRICPFRC